MNHNLLHNFDDSYPEDELPEIEEWQCGKCGEFFVDSEEYTHVFSECFRYKNYKIEPKLYWLGLKPICSECAVESNIPIDE